tara:strand:- start:1310 stop:1723 length:414 start_codon:yes stop_codon:yes gene_type:complete
MAKTSNNIDKRMSSGGEDLSPLDMNDFIKLADAEKIKADAETDLFEAIQKKFLEQKKPGESFNSWLNRTDVEELRRIELKDGSKVIDFAEYSKLKNPKIKKIDLAQGDFDKKVSDLTSKDKDLIKQLLKMSGVNVSE